MKRWGASTAKSRKWRCRNWAMRKNPYRRPHPRRPNVKNYSYTVVDGEVYFRENSIMVSPG